MKRSSLFTAATMLAFWLIFSIADARAAELRVLAGGGIAPALNELKAQFERTSGHTLVIVYATTPELIKEATSGTPFDFGVVPVDVMKDAAARARFTPEPTTDVARVGYGVVVRTGAPKLDLSTTDAFKRAMLQAPSIATIPESAAGAQILRVFARLGIEAEMKAKTKTVGTPPQIVQAVIQGDAALGIFLTSVFSVPGVELAGQFPGDLQQDLVYAAAPGTNARDATAAKAFMDFLKSPEAAVTIRAKGMRPG